MIIVPTVSVVLNCYNQSQYVDEAVHSVLDQTFGDFELLIVDNGSTDDTPDLLEAYRSDPRVRLFLHRRNEPVSKRFNQAVAEANGEFISFLYSDDRLLPDKLERQTSRFAQLGPEYGVVYSPPLGENALNGKRWQSASVGTSGDAFADLMLRYGAGQIDMVSPLTRRECLLEHRFDESVFAEGEGVFLRIALTYRFSYVDEPLVVLRDHLFNAGKAISRNREIHAATVARLRAHPALDAQRRALVDRYQAKVLRSYAWQGARLGAEPSWVGGCLKDAIKLSVRDSVSLRSVAALGLIALPPRLRRAVNRAGNLVTRPVGNPVLIDEYVGLS